MDSVKQALAEAAAAFVTALVPQLSNERAELLHECIYGQDTDMRVVLALKAGTITLEGVNPDAGQYVEIFRVAVEPLREVQLQ